MRKCLFIQTAFIGDVVLATALIEKMHQHFPEAQIDFLVRKGNEGLLQGHPFLHKTWVWTKKKNKYKNLFNLIREIRIEKYDLVVNLQRFAATGMLTVFSGATETIGFDKNPWSRFFTKRIHHIISNAAHPLHEVDRNQQLIAHLTDSTPAKPRLYPDVRAMEKVQPLKATPYIVIAPASVWFTKQWPAEKWTSFIQLLPQALKVYLIGGPEDTALCADIVAKASHDNIQNLCGILSFLESIALQQDAQMNYVNDSAPMHFASAVNAPVTAIYCSTLPSFGFGPLSSKSFVIETPTTLSCRPCGLHGHASCKEQHFNCANKIDPHQLLATLNA